MAESEERGDTELLTDAAAVFCVSPPSARLGDLTGVRHHSGSQAISIKAGHETTTLFFF